MWLIVGLGNPGAKYLFTRHNLGFMLLDYFHQSLSRSQSPLIWQDQFKGQFIKTTLDDKPVGLLKPQTFMNLSGQSVQPCLGFYKIELNQLLVIHDEADLPFGQMKIQKNRGHGGHNGIRDISQQLGSADYIRIKFGVGRPPHPDFPVADYLLQNFSKEELQQLPPLFDQCIKGIHSLLKDGVEKTSNSFNQMKKSTV